MENEFTHILSLWLHNEYPLYHEWTGRTSDLFHENKDRDNTETLVRINLADEMRDAMVEWWDIRADEDKHLRGFWSDLVRRALWRVDWLALAQEFIDAHKGQEFIDAHKESNQ